MMTIIAFLSLITLLAIHEFGHFLSPRNSVSESRNLVSVIHPVF
ncbi:MAG: hypothetical protein V1905_00955 [bacterium]